MTNETMKGWAGISADEGARDEKMKGWGSISADGGHRDGNADH